MRQRGVEAWTKWRKLIAEQESSGLSAAAFCRERGLCAPHFFAWKKRLRATESSAFVEVKVSAAPEARVEHGVRNGGAAMQNIAGGAAIEVRLRSGRSLVVAPGFDADHLRGLLAVLDAAS